jgi:hypothetical protein
MVTPEVVGHIDPAGWSGLTLNGTPGNRRTTVRVVRPADGRVNAGVHDGQASCGPVTCASRFLTGLVTCFATHDGIPAVARAASRR